LSAAFHVFVNPSFRCVPQIIVHGGHAAIEPVSPARKLPHDPSLMPSRTGVALGPRGVLVYRPHRAPGTTLALARRRYRQALQSIGRSTLAMDEAKTKPSDSCIEVYLASRASGEQLAEAKALLALLQRITGERPRMWGPSIVGFGSYRYPLASGKLGESCATGFAVRGKEFVVYLVGEGTDQPALLAKVGKHRVGKACLYFKRLADLDQEVLEQLVVGSLAELGRRYGQHNSA
jgi:hypothetical protein